MDRIAIDGLWGRTVQKVAGSPAFARVGPHVVPPVDRALHRLTGGRVLLSRALLPGLVLTTTGRRSGLSRESPLMCVPEPEGTWLVLGSNFGQTHHPAWTANLLARPEASISYGREDIPVTAELLEGEARATAWDRATAIWPTFDRYAARAERQIRVFRLHRT
ncbi:nitroreductase family deazaflavin-dependent oxidoreductase [Iamia majanohamensis]|uniref:Nitroreductase family deazaflavin-dependent oxidoreductase n=1 Tax=Iamia majanohamensis TaxID=467976 RepID=A0AAE9YIE8_9ACTN|nr:nitroreductase family deazaflavin-dependent oxidoreductase [Iamia majanohamensis]WCO69122.1 nitroreductase family deazaflavin-dependent oxidoreductase [Iamia majanohamensis]